MAITTAGTRGAVGYQYRTVVTLRESGGAAAPIIAIDLTFVNGSTTVAKSRHDKPISDTSNMLPAGAVMATRELLTTDDTAVHAFATSVQVKVTYADSSTSSTTATGSGDVPPLPPLPPTTYSLLGVITNEAGAGIGGARVEGLNGANAGKSTIADASGAYTLAGLTAETFRLRASADGYAWGEQNVTIPLNARADFTLRRPASAPCAYAIDPTSARVTTGGPYTVTVTRTSGSCGWQASSDSAWLVLGSTSGTGSATVTYTVWASDTFRSGTVTFAWAGGSAHLTVTQAPDPIARCKGASLTIAGWSGGAWSVPAAGGTYAATVVGISDLPGLCSTWMAFAVPGGISFAPDSGAFTVPAAQFTITVLPNTSGAPRTIQINVSASGFGGGGAATVTVNQGG